MLQSQMSLDEEKHQEVREVVVQGDAQNLGKPPQAIEVSEAGMKANGLYYLIEIPKKKDILNMTKEDKLFWRRVLQVKTEDTEYKRGFRIKLEDWIDGFGPKPCCYVGPLKRSPRSDLTKCTELRKLFEKKLNFAITYNKYKTCWNLSTAKSIKLRKSHLNRTQRCSASGRSLYRGSCGSVLKDPKGKKCRIPLNVFRKTGDWEDCSGFDAPKLKYRYDMDADLL